MINRGIDNQNGGILNMCTQLEWVCYWNILIDKNKINILRKELKKKEYMVATSTFYVYHL